MPTDRTSSLLSIARRSPESVVVGGIGLLLLVLGMVNGSGFISLVGAIVICWAFVGYNKQRARDRLHAEFSPVAEFAVGRYVLGLPKVGAAQLGMRCMVTNEWFIFVDNLESPVDKIHRSSVLRVSADIRSHMTQRLTATRMVTLGVFALAAPKRKRTEEYWLALEWKTENGMDATSVFEFQTSDGANTACSAFNKYARPIHGESHPAVRPSSMPQALSAPQPRVERDCPFCAEPILAAAKVCKHCRREIVPLSTV